MMKQQSEDLVKYALIGLAAIIFLLSTVVGIVIMTKYLEKGEKSYLEKPIFLETCNVDAEKQRDETIRSDPPRVKKRQSGGLKVKGGNH